jgi:hypothetical protein
VGAEEEEEEEEEEEGGGGGLEEIKSWKLERQHETDYNDTIHTVITTAPQARCY